METSLQSHGLSITILHVEKKSFSTERFCGTDTVLQILSKSMVDGEGPGELWEGVHIYHDILNTFLLAHCLK